MKMWVTAGSLLHIPFSMDSEGCAVYLVISPDLCLRVAGYQHADSTSTVDRINEWSAVHVANDCLRLAAGGWKGAGYEVRWKS